MTQFEQLKLIYNQLFNLADEITFMVEKEEFNEAISKLQHKDNLIKTFLTAKKTVELDESQEQEMLLLDEKLKEKEVNNIEILKNLRSDVAAELRKTKKSLKVNNAYSVHTDEHQGSMFDLSE